MSHIEEARKVISESWEFAGNFDYAIDKAVKALDRAGLLKSDLHERALKACEAFDQECPDAFPQWWAVEGSPAYREVRSVGRTSLKTKQPKPRYAVRVTGSTSPIIGRGGFIVDDTHSPGRNFGGLTEAQARAMADALNKLEGGER